MSQADRSPLLFLLDELQTAPTVVPTGNWTMTGTNTLSGTNALTGPTSISRLTLAAPAAGTGTVVSAGRQSSGWYTVTVDYTHFVAAAANSDVTLFTLAAKQRILAVVADTTAAYAGLSGTIQLSVGSTTGGEQIILHHDVKTAAVTAGLVDADLGSSQNAAGVIQGGYMPSWTTTTAVKARIASGSGNVGTGTASSMTAGSTTYYFKIETVS